MSSSPSTSSTPPAGHSPVAGPMLLTGFAPSVSLLLLLGVTSISGCVLVPPPKSPFEKCMEVVGRDKIYQQDALVAATWCDQHMNGGIK